MLIRCNRSTSKTVARLVVSVLFSGVTISSNATSLQAFAPPPAVAPRVGAEDSTQSAAEKYRLRTLDESLRPLELKNPRTKTEQARLDATAWFMAGKLRETRNDFAGALKNYQQAAKLDPHSIAIYRALIPLAISLNQVDEAIQYALKLVELDPSDYRLLRRLGVHMAARNKLPQAIQMLEQATRSPELRKTSGIYVTLMRDLAIFYRASGQKNKSADAYAVVFDALINADKYKLDFRTRKALLGDPSKTYEQIGQTFLDAQRPELAVKAFERAAEARIGKPGTLSYNLARVYLQTKQLAKALEQLQVYFDAQLQSKGRDAYQLLANILKAMERSGELVVRLKTLAEKDPRNAPLQFFLADQYLAKSQLDDAEEFYKKGLESSKISPGYLGLAHVHRRQSRPEELLDSLSKGLKEVIDALLFAQIRRVPNVANSKTFQTHTKPILEDRKLLEGLFSAGRKRLEADAAQLDFSESYLLARLAVESKRTRDVVDFYRAALKASRRRALPIYQELGGYLLQVNDYAQAATVFQEAAADPALVQAKPNFLFRLSQASELAGDTKTALSAVQEARKLRPTVSFLHYQEGWIYYHSRQFDQAIQVFNEVISKYPEPQHKEIVKRCQYTLSNVYVQKGEMRKGEEVLEEILKTDPDDPSVNNDLGYLYADQGKNLEQAEKMIRKAIKAEPENAAFLDSMGWVLFKLGKFEEAAPYLEKAVKLPLGSDATIWDHLGDCYDRLNQSEKAATAWQKALEQAKKSSRPDEKIIQSLGEKLKKK